jgi:DNA-directed RNA polymerase specialized sigma24 family protein
VTHPSEPLRRLSPREMRDILAQSYPVVHRLSRGLVGREAVARRVERFVLSRGIRLMPRWDADGEPAKWFYHHTILASRRVQLAAVDSRDDALIDTANASSSEYVAFIHAIRSLPHQQKEAFILHHAEKCDARTRSVAMDCSTVATDTHLTAATKAIQTIAGEKFESLVAELARVYAALSPTAKLVVPRMNWIVRRYVWPRRIARLIAWIFTLSVAAGLAWLTWWVYQRLEI